MTSAIETPLQASKMFESPKPWSPKAQSYSGNSIRSKFRIKIVQTLCLILNFDKVKLFASNKRSQAAMIHFLYKTYVCVSSVPPGVHPQFEDAREVDASLPHDVWLHARHRTQILRALQIDGTDYQPIKGCRFGNLDQIQCFSALTCSDKSIINNHAIYFDYCTSFRQSRLHLQPNASPDENSLNESLQRDTQNLQALQPQTLQVELPYKSLICRIYHHVILWLRLHHKLLTTCCVVSPVRVLIFSILSLCFKFHMFHF